MNAPMKAAVIQPQVCSPTLAELAAEYYNHAVIVRGVLTSTAEAERPYLKRFFDWFGPPESAADLFPLVTAVSVTQCLLNYAAKYGPGSRCCMQKTVRLFLRFGYHRGYLDRDLSALSPSVRSMRMGKVVWPIPPACLETLLGSIHGDTPGPCVIVPSYAC